MSQLCTDPLTGRTVIFARDRAERPNEFASGPVVRAAPEEPVSACPFCPGNEAQTPEPLLEILNDAGEWTRRAVPNKYPLCSEHDEGLAGAHEVIIESRRHCQATGELTEAELAGVLGVYAARLDYWRRDGRFPFRLLFKNVGRSGGASLSHLHSQLVATESISQQAALESRTVTTPTAWAEWIDAEFSGGQRAIAQTKAFVAFCPRVSRTPYETWIMPRDKAPWFEESLAHQAPQQALAGLLLPIVRRIESLIAPAGYNFILHNCPSLPGLEQRHWWRIEIVPRAASLAGFELGTGVFINTLPPEEAAARLRD